MFTRRIWTTLKNLRVKLTRGGWKKLVRCRSYADFDRSIFDNANACEVAYLNYATKDMLFVAVYYNHSCILQSTGVKVLCSQCQIE